jgi:hypothetical protein
MSLVIKDGPLAAPGTIRSLQVHLIGLREPPWFSVAPTSSRARFQLFAGVDLEHAQVRVAAVADVAALAEFSIGL